MKLNIMNSLPVETQKKWQALLNSLEQMGTVIVAFSGGVDSALLSTAAHIALGQHMLAITVDSPVNPEGELEVAQNLAKQVGFNYEIILHDDLASPEFVTNPPLRCYHCKLTRLGLLFELATEQGYQYVAEGSNADDDLDYRPGALAVEELGTRSPLKEVGLTKAEIRLIAHALELAVWDRPSAPCLATRFPYNTVITPEGLNRVGRAEVFLKQKGFHPVRVRHLGETARIEIDPHMLMYLTEVRDEVVTYFKELGYQYVAVDLEGYRQGSLNEVLSR